MGDWVEIQEHKWISMTEKTQKWSENIIQNCTINTMQLHDLKLTELLKGSGNLIKTSRFHNGWMDYNDV